MCTKKNVNVLMLSSSTVAIYHRVVESLDSPMQIGQRQ